MELASRIAPSAVKKRTSSKIVRCSLSPSLPPSLPLPFGHGGGFLAGHGKHGGGHR